MSTTLGMDFLLKEVKTNIDIADRQLNKTMNERKTNHNIADNSTYKYLRKEERNYKNHGEYFYGDYKDDYKNSSMTKILEKRKSIRDYTQEPIQLSELIHLLHYTFGYRKYGAGIYGYKKYPYSYVPSSGGVATITHYVFVRNVDGLEAGIYRYNRDKQALEYLEMGNIYYKMKDVLYGLDFSISSSFAIFLFADLEKLIWKYGERSYRYAHIDAGVVAQTLHLFGMECGIGSCMIAGFADEYVKDIVKVSDYEYPMLLICFGKYKHDSAI